MWITLKMVCVTGEMQTNMEAGIKKTTRRYG